VSTNFISPLPASVAEFQQKYPECYAQVFGSDPPANCPLDSVSLQILIDSVPMRKTHRDVSAHSMAVVPTSDQSSQMMQVLQIMMQQQQQQLLQQKPQLPLNIQFLKPGLEGKGSRARSSSSSSNNTSQQSLSLTMLPKPLAKKGAEEGKEELEEKDEEEKDDEQEQQQKQQQQSLQTIKYKGPKHSVETSLALIQRQMESRESPGQSKAKGKAKSKAKSKAEGKAKAKAKSMAKSKAKSKGKLGCSKCRYSERGCGRCR